MPLIPDQKEEKGRQTYGTAKKGGQRREQRGMGVQERETRTDVKLKGSGRSVKMESDHGEEERVKRIQITHVRHETICRYLHTAPWAAFASRHLSYFSSGNRSEWGFLVFLLANAEQLFWPAMGEKNTPDSVRKASAAGLWPTPQVLWAITDNYLQSRCFSLRFSKGRCAEPWTKTINVTFIDWFHIWSHLSHIAWPAATWAPKSFIFYNILYMSGWASASGFLLSPALSFPYTYTYTLTHTQTDTGGMTAEQIWSNSQQWLPVSSLIWAPLLLVIS